MRNGSVFRLQGPVQLNSDGSLLLTAGGVCCIRWYGSQHDTQLIKSILQGNMWWAQFQSNNTGVLGARVRARVSAHVCLSTRSPEEHFHSTQNKGQGHCVCLQYAFSNEVISRKKKEKAISDHLKTHENKIPFPISHDRADDSVVIYCPGCQNHKGEMEKLQKTQSRLMQKLENIFLFSLACLLDLLVWTEWGRQYIKDAKFGCRIADLKEFPPIWPLLSVCEPDRCCP